MSLWMLTTVLDLAIGMSGRIHEPKRDAAEVDHTPGEIILIEPPGIPDEPIQ